MGYEPQDVEKKWQARWETERRYHALNPGEPGFDAAKPSYYVLDMFPYPSGSGLHVGHASGYIGTDIVARRRRMEGCNVLHPMGWDAFGLPAEQYAIQTNQHPRVTTDTNAANFRRQLKLLGLSYDWQREVDTSDPRYYRWTQWVFLQLYKKGLVYRKEMPVWWCEDLKTVLANEEVINGRSERGNHPCERRMLTQWVFRITAYADRLVEDLEGLDWPESVKKMQREWVGKSIGAELSFELENEVGSIDVFSTRPDTLFGVSGLVLAPEHPLVARLTTADERESIARYVQVTASKSERDRKSEAGQISAQFTGAYALHPLVAGRRIPIYIADYVLLDYGTGAVMAVPAHDERDFQLAQRTGLDVVHVVAADQTGTAAEECFTGEGFLIASGEFTGLTSEEARERIIARLEETGRGKKRVSYRIRDWIFSRQRYWGEPFPLVMNERGDVLPVDEDELPVTLPPMEDFAPSEDGSAPLARLKDWVVLKDPKSQELLRRVTDTMPGWAGSCWYYLRFMDPRNEKEAFGREAVDYWKQVDLYVGGASHAVMHLLYARFWHKALFDLGLVPTKEPFKKLFNQGMVTAYAFKDAAGRLIAADEVEPAGVGVWRRKSTGEVVERLVSKMAKSLRNVVNPDDVIRERGCDTLRLFEMFLGPLDTEKPWTDEAISGCEKFLRRAWTLLVAEDGIPNLLPEGEISNVEIERSLHRCLDRVNRSFELFNFNTAVAGLMESLNELTRAPQLLSRGQAEMFVKMLSPFAPHFSAELWERLGMTGPLDFEPWPALDPVMLRREVFELVIQVNGKVRAKVEMALDASEPDIKAVGRKQVASWIEGKEVVKEIYVKNKLLSIVIR